MTVAAAVAGMVVPGVASAVVTIDDFEVGVVDIEVDEAAGTSTVTETGLDTNSVIGGVRQVTAAYISGPGGASTVSARTVDVLGNGAIALNSDAGVIGRWSLLYDQNGAGLGGVDLTQSGANTGFAIDFIDADAGALASVRLTDTLGNTLEQSLATGGAGILFFEYANFSGTGDITLVDEVLFDITGVVDGDYTIRLIESNIFAIDDDGTVDLDDDGTVDDSTDGTDDDFVIPEPMTAGLAFMSLAALSLATRRRR